MELTLETIQKTIAEADNFLEIGGIERHKRLCYRLLMEEYLLDYLKEDPGAGLSIECRTTDKKISVIVGVRGKERNIVQEHESEFADQLVEGLDRAPKWKYVRGENVITWSPKPAAPDLKSIRYMIDHLAERKGQFALAIIIRFLNMGLNVIEPILTAEIIVAYSGSHIQKIMMIAGLMLLQRLLSNLFTFLGSHMLRHSYSSMLKKMRTGLTERVLHIKTACIDETGSGLFIQRLISDTDNAVEQVDNLLEISTDIFRLISLLISFAIISPKMLVFELILFAIYGFIQRMHNRSLTVDGRRSRTAEEKQAGIIGEMVRAHRDVKLLHAENSLMEDMRESVEESVDRTTDLRVRSMKFILLRTQFVGVTNFIYMALLALFMVKDGMPPETALVLFNYNGSMYGCAYSLSQFISAIYDLALYSERIYQLMISSDYETETFGDVHLDRVRGEIEFQDVSFSYRNSNGGKVDVLDKLNLRIGVGEIVAFVGKSGCGKSTILSLIERLYDPDDGKILLDGYDIRDLDMDTVRSNIVMVSQMPYIFHMTVRENLMVAKRDVTEEELIEVCKKACIYDDIVNMPRGFDTLMGEGGVTLSGGQRQRLAIARSLLKPSPILILDEATSALDSITQTQIQSAIEDIRGQRTILMVAHRLSTVIHAQKIFFIEDGRVLAQGTHETLLKSCDAYRKLYSEEASA